MTEKANILIIDDEEAIRDSCSQALKKEGYTVKTAKDGFIITDEYMQTSAKGVFAAGDVRQKSLRQVVTSVSDGAIAVDSARRYLEGIEK